MKRCALLLAVGLLVAADAPKEDTGKEVVQLLGTLNDAYQKQDVDTIKRLTSEDLIVVTSSGHRQTRDEQLQALTDLKISEYTMEEVQVKMPSKDVVIVSFFSSVKGSFKEQALPPRITVSSVWANRNGKWLEVFYQGTARSQK